MIVRARYVRRWFRTAATTVAVVALVSIVTLVVTLEAVTDQSYSPMWTLLIALMLLCCMIAVAVWMLPLAPGDVPRAPSSWVRRGGLAAAATDAWPVVQRRPLPKPLAEGALYESPKPVYAVAAVPRPSSSEQPTVPHGRPRPASVAEAERTPLVEPGGDAEVDGFLAASDPAGGTPPDDGYLRGFAIGAVDHEGEDPRS